MNAVRFVALGDSVTAGLGDARPDGTWRGWAALLAEGLAPDGRVEFHNLAEPGALSHTLVDRQLPAALRLLGRDGRPALAAGVIGVNDTLRASFDLTRIGRAMDHMVSELDAAGALVLTARLPDPGRMLRLPASLARPLARRVRAVNAIADAVAARHATVHLDLADHPGTYDRRMWSVDRLHPSERGHRFVARGFADLLTARGVAVHPPSSEPGNPPPSRAASARWMATKGTRWVLERSTDLVPALVGLAAAEWWHGVRGLAHDLDQHLGREADRVIAAWREGLPVDRTVRALD
jgi:lysophospholipase L1-like esterase